MRLLCVLLALTACKKHDAAAPPPKRDAAAVTVDWTRCEEQIRTLAQVPTHVGRVEALIDACPVCGDWKPVLEWNTPRTEGGATREVIEERMNACNAWCSSKAKDFFLAGLEKARGEALRAPWRYLADECKDKVSAVPDGRFESAPYFALDRIGRAIAARGGTAAEQLLAIPFVLPPITATGSAIEVPETDAPAGELVAADQLLTVLGDQLYVAPQPLARLGATGVQLAQQESYPGHAATAPDFAKPLVVIAARRMPAKQLLAMLEKTGGSSFRLAVRAKTKLVGWPMIAAVPLDLHAHVDDKTTVQDLVRRL